MFISTMLLVYSALIVPMQARALPGRPPVSLAPAYAPFRACLVIPRIVVLWHARVLFTLPRESASGIAPAARPVHAGVGGITG